MVWPVCRVRYKALCSLAQAHAGLACNDGRYPSAARRDRNHPTLGVRGLDRCRASVERAIVRKTVGHLVSEQHLANGVASGLRCERLRLGGGDLPLVVGLAKRIWLIPKFLRVATFGGRGLAVDFAHLCT